MLRISLSMYTKYLSKVLKAWLHLLQVQPMQSVTESISDGWLKGSGHGVHNSSKYNAYMYIVKRYKVLMYAYLPKQSASCKSR